MNQYKSPGNPASEGDDLRLLQRYCLLFYVGAALSVLLLTAFTVSALLLCNWLQSGAMQLFAAALNVIVLVRVIAWGRVISDRRNMWSRARQEYELNILKSNFITLASHEFRTPLSSVLLSATLIERYAGAQDAENIGKHTRKIKQVVHRMENMLDDFLSLEKLDAGQIKVIPAIFNLGVLCRSVIAEASKAAAAGHHLCYQASGDSEMVSLDEELLRYALVGLLSNAVKYAGEGANIRLLTLVAAEQVVIKVMDDGSGIEEKDQERLFTAFYRVHDSGNIPGTGLGLYLVNRYVRLMGGTLKFYSRPQEETCFEMIFPITGTART